MENGKDSSSINNSVVQDAHDFVSVVVAKFWKKAQLSVLASPKNPATDLGCSQCKYIRD